MHWDRWVKKILHNPKTKNVYPKIQGPDRNLKR